ncbi:unnamed protein product, partial [marine sediment metagenome]
GGLVGLKIILTFVSGQSLAALFNEVFSFLPLTSFNKLN